MATTHERADRSVPGSSFSFFEWVETTLQNLFGIRKHHDAGPDLREQQVGILQPTMQDRAMSYFYNF